MSEKVPTYNERIVETFKTAFEELPVTPYVSYSVHSKPESQQERQARIEREKELKKQGKKIQKPQTPQTPDKPPLLTAENHALYIGKIFKEDSKVKARIARTLGWSPELRIYGADFIEAALSYIIAHSDVKNGENKYENKKIRIVLCRKVSEILNGPDDIEGTLTHEEAIELINKIAKEKFDLEAQNLLIEGLEQNPYHSTLLSRLEKATNEFTQEFDPELAFQPRTSDDENGSPTTIVDSLDIAACLYQATKQNKAFEARIHKGVPAQLKKQDQSEKKLPKSYYTLAEVAIRLQDIISGTAVHSGASRQAVYDGVISAIVKGKEGVFADVRALQPIFEKLEKTNFQTIHVDNKNNPVRKRLLRGKARRKIASVVAICASTVAASIGAPAAVVKYQEYRQEKAAEEAVQQYIASRVKGLTWYADRLHFDVTPQTVESYAGMMIEDIHFRYGIEESILDDLHIETLIKQFLVENGRISNLPTNSQAYMRYVDEFVESNRILFQSRGVKLERPYNHMLPYLELFINAAEKDVKEHKMSFHSTEMRCPSNLCDPDNHASKNYIDLGIYVGHSPIGHKYQVYVLEENGEKVIVARAYFNDEELSKFPEIEDKEADTKAAQYMARDFIRDIKWYDAHHLYKWDELMHDLANPNYVSYIPDEYEEKAHPEPYLLERIIPYYDTFGSFSYEVIRDYCHFPENQDKYCLKAREPGEQNFTIKRGREVAYHYFDAKGQKLYRDYPYY